MREPRNTCLLDLNPLGTPPHAHVGIRVIDIDSEHENKKIISSMKCICFFFFNCIVSA